MNDGSGSGSAGPIWIDLDNAPHVPFFRPLIRGLESRGHRVWVTCRDDGVVPELARVLGVRCESVGHGRARTWAGKGLTVLKRAASLARSARWQQPALAVSHGSRPQAVAAKVLGVPALCLIDYEHAALGLLDRCVDRFLVPERLGAAAMRDAGAVRADVRTYAGLKEDVYLSEATRADIRGLPARTEDDVVVVYRPEAETAHYLLAGAGPNVEDALLGRLGSDARVVVWVVPRTREQGERLGQALTERRMRHVVVGAVDGIALIGAADLVISGGGTMAREAAALGVPSYSIFRGRHGAVDRALADEGRMTLLRGAEDVTRMAIGRRDRSRRVSVSPAAYESILDSITGSLPAR